MADGFTVYQYLELLRIWHQEILKKEKTLSTGARVYTLIFFLQTASISTVTIISGFLSSLVLGLIGSESDTTIFAIQCAITGLIVINGILTAFGYVFKPQATASSALSASRQYSGLAKELIIEIKSYEVMFAGMSDADVSKFSSPDVGVESRPHLDGFGVDLESQIRDNLCVSFETYKNRLLYYSTREQLITSGEPGLILIGYWGNKTVFDRTYVSNVLSVKDLQFMISVVDDLENTRQKRKMNKILKRIFMRMGMTEDAKNLN